MTKKIVPVFTSHRRLRVYLSKLGINLPHYDITAKFMPKLFLICCDKLDIPIKITLNTNQARVFFLKLRQYKVSSKEEFILLCKELIIPVMERQQEVHLSTAVGRRVYVEAKNSIGGLPGSIFYQTPEWRAIRYKALEEYGNSCMACGAGVDNGKVIHVDHIKPRSLYPEHALDLDNLQILCEDCNIGKSNNFDKDWRGK